VVALITEWFWLVAEVAVEALEVQQQLQWAVLVVAQVAV
jgi:hypothetical protein